MQNTRDGRLGVDSTEFRPRIQCQAVDNLGADKFGSNFVRISAEGLGIMLWYIDYLAINFVMT